MSRTSTTGRRPRVLVIAYDFPPHGAIGTMRTLRVVRQLDARRWDVTVLTGDPSAYVSGTPTDAALLERVPTGVRVLRAAAVRPWLAFQQAVRGRSRSGAAVSGTDANRTPVGSARLQRLSPLVAGLARAKDIVDAALAIPDRELGWLLPALGAGVLDRLRAAPPDVIYSSAPPWTGQLVAAGLKLALRRPWVADFRDPWARAPWRGDRYRFAMRAAGILERFVVVRADRVVFVAAGNRDDFARQYGAAGPKFHLVPNGCDPAEFDELRNLQPPSDESFVLLHAGSLYAGRTPVPVLEAIAAGIAKGVISPRHFRLRFLGASSLRGIDLPAVCRSLGLADVVEVLPRVPRSESLKAMMSASALLLLQPGHTVSVPGKVYEYLASGRPILAIAEEGEISSLIRQANAGVSLRPGDLAGMVDALAALVSRRALPTPCPRELFDGNIGAARVVEVLEQVIAPAARARLRGIEATS